MEKNITTSVIIIGGGLQGLSLLHKLTENNIDALLLTNSPIGAGQSIYNHGYFHNGFIFSSIEATQRNYMEKWPLELINQMKNEFPVYFAAPSQTLQFFTKLWTQNKKEEWKASELPPFFSLGSANKMNFVEIGDFTFNKETLLRLLLKNVENRIITGEISSFSKNNESDRDRDSIWQIHFKKNDHEELISIMGKGIAICAGAANYSLAKQIRSDPSLPNEYQIGSNLHILAVKGPSHILPRCSLVCWPLQIMIAAHPLENDQTLYYLSVFSKEQNEAISKEELPSNASSPLKREIVQHCIPSLFALLPSVQEHRHSLLWSVYSGWKINHPSSPSAHWLPIFQELEENVIMMGPDIVPNIFENAHNALLFFQKSISPGLVDHSINSEISIAKTPEELNGFLSFSEFANEFSIQSLL